MLLRLLYFLAISATMRLVTASPLPAFAGSQSIGTASVQPSYDMMTTIDQVQKLLEKDPTLPRLTRGEIEDLFEQVTKEEYQKSLQTGDLDRAHNMRSLMLVMPFNTDNNSVNNLQDLYTRPPVTKVVEEYSKPKPQKLDSKTPSTGKVDILAVRNAVPTTYKPALSKKALPAPTTYHPSNPYTKTSTAKTTTTEPEYVDLPEPLEDPPQRFSSSYNAKDTRFSPELQDVLANLGLAVQTQSRKRFQADEIFADEEAPRPAISSIIRQQPLGVEEPLAVDIGMEDFTRGLSPQMKSEDFVEFKPLRIKQDRINPELEDYLTRFGIVDGVKPDRKAKQLPPIVEKITESPISSFTKKPKTTTPPKIRRSDTDESDLRELEKLMENLRELERLRVDLTPEMLSKVDLKNYKLSGSLLAQGPDPIAELGTNRDRSKNDIKRQSSEPTRFNLDLGLDNETTTTAAPETAEAPTTPETTSDSSSTTTSDSDFDSDSDTDSATEESRNGSIADLEDSFGGPDPVTDGPPPPMRKNGFYFLADLNKFLEVGDGDDQVVVRYQKRIGDPRLFIPVKIP